MQQLQPKYQQDQCPRCGGGFMCKASNISSCDCLQIVISKEEQEYIALKFSDCVCNNCLKELKYEYYLTHHHNKSTENEA